MLEIQTDLHTHTILSGHAFCTTLENVREAAAQGLTAIALTEHVGAPFIGDNLVQSLFALGNRRILPPEIQGVRVYPGAEVDILPDGGLYGENLPFPAPSGGRFYADTVLEYALSSAKVVIASYHFGDVDPSDLLANTNMFVRAVSNPAVHMLGHLERNGLSYEIDPILLAAKAHGVVVELNEGSLNRGSAAGLRCRAVMERCGELDVPIAVNSDAHFSTLIGRYPHALAMLREIGFPEALVVNRTLETTRADFLKEA